MKQVKGLEDIPGYNTQSDSNLLKELKIVVDILPTYSRTTPSVHTSGTRG